MKKTIAVLLGIMLCFPSLVQAKKHVLRIATLAPKGSSWVNIMMDFRREVRKKSKRKIKLKFYTGGRMGDEKVVVRKMKAGSLQGGVVPSLGLAQIEKSILALQLPGLFRNYKELDYVRGKLDDELRAKFLAKGFVLLGWGDLGYVYLYSKNKIESVGDLKKSKIWGWVDDPLTRKYTKKAGVTPTLLSLLDVRASLQTGAVDTVIGTPLSVIAMQWHPYLKYRVAFRFAIGIGATVITKKAFDAMPKELQTILLNVAKKHHKRLVETIRKDNLRALYTLKKRGIKAVKVSRKNRKEIRRVAKKTRKAFIGELFSKKDLRKIYKHLRAYRKKNR